MAHLAATGLQTANGTAPIERRDVSGLWSNPSCKAAPFATHPRLRSRRPKPPSGGVCVKRIRIMWCGLPRCDVRRSLGRAGWPPARHSPCAPGQRGRAGGSADPHKPFATPAVYLVDQNGRSDPGGAASAAPLRFRQRGARDWQVVGVVADFVGHNAIPGFTFPSRSSQPRASAQPMQMQVPAPPTVTGAR